MAGIAVACVIAALLVAGLVVAFCCGLLPCCRASRPHKQCAAPLALKTNAVHCRCAYGSSSRHCRRSIGSSACRSRKPFNPRCLRKYYSVEH